MCEERPDSPGCRFRGAVVEKWQRGKEADTDPLRKVHRSADRGTGEETLWGGGALACPGREDGSL